MKISLSWAQQTTKTDITSVGADVIVQKIGAQLGAVEEVINLTKVFDGALVARVVTCIKHPNADKLSVCMIDDGGVVANIDRDEQGFVQVVCGAPNVQQDLMVAWLPPGATVPSTAHDAEPFVLGARELRGVLSNGMLASPQELGISDSHDGILALHQNDGVTLKPGMPFTDLFDLDDTIIDLENKMFTHRPDCFGILGVARELAGIQHFAYTSPDWYTTTPVFENISTKQLVTSVESNNVPRFMAVVMDSVTVGASPIAMQSQLSRVGIRPINNLVDITNWLMHLTGQPLHAYDYDKVLKICGSDVVTLKARQSKKGDSFNLLSGKQFIAQDDQAVVICAGDSPIGLGGVMGGADTEVDESTTSIILECANFDMYSIRKTAMKYGLFTDAVTRFNKGQSPLQNDKILAKAMTMVTELAGGVQASEVKDEATHTPQLMNPIAVTATFINTRLGSELRPAEIATLLNNVECNTSVNGDTITVQIPFWRRDLTIAEDIVEEVGRLYGYDKLPVELPRRQSAVTKKDPLITFKSTVRTILSNAGANELLTYSFVHGKQFENVGQDTSHAFTLSNALSPELQYYRLSLTPNILEKIHPNAKEGYGNSVLFEIGKAHTKQWIDKDGLPIEAERLALVVAADAKAAKNYQGAPYYQAKKYTDTIFTNLGIAIKYMPFAESSEKIISSEPVAPFMPSRSAIMTTLDGEFIGVIGEYTARAAKNLKLPVFCAGFELDIEQLRKYSPLINSTYTALSKYPSTSQDISFKVSLEASYTTVATALQNALQLHTPNDSTVTFELIDIYTNDTNKHVTFRLQFTNYAKTMHTSQVNDLLDAVAIELHKSIGADRI